MKSILLLGLFFTAFSVSGKNYYIDPSSEAVNTNGSIEAPWKGFEPLQAAMSSLRPGDTIFLKRNELFFEKLNLKCSGTQQAPIVFTSYGTGNAKPILMYKPPLSEKIQIEEFCIRVYKSSYVKFIGLEITDDNIDPENHNSLALIKIAFSIDESSNISILKCDISRVGIGVNMVGDNNLVDSCIIKNLRMVRNTEGGWDDYGANAVVVAGNHNIISHCFFKDCWAYSYDFEYDGGAIEMAGPSCSNNRIISNMAYNCNGFMEMGSTDGGVLRDNLLENNLVFNCGDLLYINNDGPYAVEVLRLELANNIFIQTIHQLTKPKSMISMAKPAEKQEVILMRGNIFWLPMQMDVAKTSLFLNNQMTHTGNIYYLGRGQLNYQPDQSEIILNAGSPVFRQLKGNAIFSEQMNYFPFKYLLKYWYLAF